MSALPAQRVEMIPIDRITIVNPRIRNKRTFKEIVDNIAQVGLKKPITVNRRPLVRSALLRRESTLGIEVTR